MPYTNTEESHQSLYSNSTVEGVAVVRSLQPPQTEPQTTLTRECVVCLSAPAVMALVPCGHQCACEQCSPILEGEPCPICRNLVTTSMRIFR